MAQASAIPKLSKPVAPDLCAVTLLAIDDDPLILDLISETLSMPGLLIVTTTDPLHGLDLVRNRHPQIILLDLMMPAVNGMKLLDQILTIDPGANVVLITGHYSIDSAVEAIQKGARDYLPKPLPRERLIGLVNDLMEEARSQHRTLQLERSLVDAYQFEGIIGRSPAMQELFARVQRVAPHFQNLLITGATGTGKELVARAIHRRSPVAAGRFLVCNCSAIVETLFESELFGHVKGAFTGAVQDKVGLFEYANDGVLLLDEIGEMPLTVQAKLLRVLQNQEIQRVGSPATRKISVKVIAATHRDLRSMVAEKTFREDLFYRLSMIDIHLPSLAERKEDLPLLERHFLERFAAQYQKPIRGITRRAQAQLSLHGWPGNIRELENVLGNACMMTEGSYVDVCDLPQYLLDSATTAAPAEAESVALDELQWRHAMRTLDRTGGNKALAAKALGISRSTLYRLLGSRQAGRH
jgi:DNA-binding NtrC family response regulator